MNPPTSLDLTTKLSRSRESKQHGGCPSATLYFPEIYRSDILSMIPMAATKNFSEPWPPSMTASALSRDT
jgi:hypothetical protein